MSEYTYRYSPNLIALTLPLRESATGGDTYELFPPLYFPPRKDGNPLTDYWEPSLRVVIKKEIPGTSTLTHNPELSGTRLRSPLQTPAELTEIDPPTTFILTLEEIDRVWEPRQKYREMEGFNYVVHLTIGEMEASLFSWVSWENNKRVLGYGIHFPDGTVQPVDKAKDLQLRISEEDVRKGIHFRTEILPPTDPLGITQPAGLD